MKNNIGGIWKLPSPNQAPNPFEMGYAPELYASPVLDPSLVSYYQYQIGVLRLMVELGMVDINTDVSMMASFLALPIEGHLEAVFNFYIFLCAKHNTRLALDPSYPDMDDNRFLLFDSK